MGLQCPHTFPFLPVICSLSLSPPNKQIRIVERLGEIQGSRANSAADDTRCESGGRDSFGSSSSGGAAGGIASGIWAGGSNDSSAGANHSSELVLSRGEGSSLSVFGDGGIGARASVGGGQEYDLGHHHALDDTALNELGDAELEVLLEQMWMKVMGQVSWRITPTEGSGGSGVCSVFALSVCCEGGHSQHLHAVDSISLMFMRI